MSRKTRKLIWSAPLLAVLAVAGALALFVALTPNGAQAHDLPGPVSDLDAEGISWSSIKLTWKAPTTGGAVTGYRIDVSEDEFIWEPLVMDTGNTRTSYTHTGLKGGVTRYYRVFALNAAGAGPSPVGDDASNDLFVAGITLDAEAPGQVLNLSAEGVSDDQIDVTWDAPSSTGGADITHYCLVVGANRAAITSYTDTDLTTDCATTNAAASTVEAANTAIDGTSTDATVIMVAASKTELEHDDLEEKTTRHYRLYALTSVGVSSTATNIAKATTKASPTPAAPRGVKAVSTGNTLNLYWNWPANALDTPLADFVVETRSSIQSSWTTAVETPSGAFPLQATHTPTGDVIEDPDDATNDATWVEYRVRIGATGTPSRAARVTSATPTGNWSLPDNDDPGGLPGLDTPGTITPTPELRTIALTWERDGDTGETIPSGFVIDAVMGAFSDSPLGFQPLQANTSYTGRVSGTQTTSRYTHRGVKPDQTWYYRIFPYSSGSKLYGDPMLLEAMTKMAEPPAQYSCNQVSTAEDGPTKITITWPSPGADGGSPVTGFLVQVADDTDNNGAIDASPTWTDVPNGRLDATARSYTYAPKGADALDAGSVRWFRVIVLNSVNTDDDGAFDADGPDNTAGNADDPDLAAVCSRIMGETAEAGTPGIPDGLVAEPARDAGSLDPDNPVPNSERGVMLLWNAPDDPAGDEVTGYVIARRVRDDGTSAWSDWETDWAEIDASATTYTDTDLVSGLDDGEARQYRVSAQSGSGTGMYAEITYPHAEAVHGPVVVELTAPSGVIVSTFQNTINVTWDTSSIENAEQVKVVLFDSGVTKIVDLKTFGAASDPGAHDFIGVDAGTYKVVVASFRTGDPHKISALMEVTIQ